jgi:agmatinase
MSIMSRTENPPHRSLWSGLATDDPDAEIGVLGVPFDGASSFRKGSAEAPKRIRSLTPHVAPMTEDGSSLAGVRLRDHGDVAVGATWETMRPVVEKTASEVLRHSLALFLGGDHSVSIPLASAAANAIDGPMGVLHLDAHLDLMDTFEGVPWSHACALRRVLELPNTDPSRCAAVGIRSWLAEEAAFVEDHPNLLVRTARDVWRQGIESVADAVCRQLADSTGVYVTLDIDVLDPAFAPGTGAPEAAGLSTRDLLELLRVVFDRLPVRALDIVEVSPPLDPSDITSFAAIKVLYEAFGWAKQRTEERDQIR